MTTTAPDDRRQALATVADEARACRACPLHVGARNAVPGEGNPDAEVMLIGEAPGQNEDLQGRPFVGASGQFLTQMLEAAGFPRSEVFIANVAKHRPPGNRDPLPEEIAACAGFLQRQIDAIDPLVIVTLGRFSMARYFPGERVSRIHGQARVVGGRVILPLYHPAAALHQGSLRKVLEADFAALPGVVDRARRRRERLIAVSTGDQVDAAPLARERGPEDGSVARPERVAPVQQSFGIAGLTVPDASEAVTPRAEPETRVAPPKQLPLL